jgi:hypothetical protein
MKTSKKEMKEICKPLNIIVGERWLDDFLVKAKDLQTLKKLEPMFEIVNIGIGYDYNSLLVTYYAKRNNY